MTERMTAERRAALIRYCRAHPRSLANSALLELEAAEAERDVWVAACVQQGQAARVAEVAQERRIAEMEAEVARLNAVLEAARIMSTPEK